MPVPPWLCVGVSLRIGNIEKVITLWDVRAFKSKNWTSVEYTTWNSIFTNFFLCFWIFLELFFIYSKIVWQTDFNVSRIFNRVFSNCFLAFQQQKCHCPPFSWWQIMADYVANSLLDKGRKNEPAFFFFHVWFICVSLFGVKIKNKLNSDSSLSVAFGIMPRFKTSFQTFN